MVYYYLMMDIIFISWYKHEAGRSTSRKCAKITNILAESNQPHVNLVRQYITFSTVIEKFTVTRFVLKPCSN